MKYGIPALLLLTFTFATQAATWTSPDGKLSFDLPADGSLIEMKNPPAPAMALWTTIDTNTRLIFIVVPNPQNAPLIRAALEEGTLKPFPGATLLSSNEMSLGRVPVFTIAGKLNGAGYVQQSILAFNGVTYKVMAAGPNQISSDPHLAGVFQSLKILDPSATPPAANTPNNRQRPNQDPNKRSIEIAEIGWAILFIAGIIYYVRRSSRPKPTPPPPPPAP